ncbi:hypothetical protein ACCS93_38245 [Rhizobium ruizarguesonis]
MSWESWEDWKSWEVVEKLLVESVFVEWVDATFPVMGKFLSEVYGWDGRIVVDNEYGNILYRIEPRNQAQAAKEMNLVRSRHYKFRRRQSSWNFKEDSGWVTLCKSLAAQLEEDSDRGAKWSLPTLLNDFHQFTMTEKYCPGLGETVKEILGPPASK